MHFTTVFTMTAAFTLANATPGMMRRYTNDTTSISPIGTTSSNSSGWETIPTITPSNSTTETTFSISSTEIQTYMTSVASQTLTYTLGPENSSSVVTTIVESTSTITMTSTLYITMTETDEPAATTDPVTSDSGNETTTMDGGSSPTLTDGGGLSASASLDPLPSQSDASLTGVDTGSDAAQTDVSLEPTITVTNYLTTTETITMQPVQTGIGAGGATDGINTGALGQSGSNPISSLNGGQGGACSVTTITATIVEMSTVTVTPSGTENVPIPPTATPSYGFGNGTDPTSGYPTASSGFLTFYRRSRPTKIWKT